jgi:asparagine synthase (glutamine-hydrolysing)
VSGVFAELDLSDGARAVGPVEDALHALAHRGPDGSGFWRGDGVTLGVCCLALGDLDGTELPLWNESHTCCIASDAQLINSRELRLTLESKGHVFQTATRAEVMLHAYEEWGTDCLLRFDGAFAVVIWDRDRRALFLARDRLGRSPLYYYRDSERLVCASEIKAILADGSIPRRVNLRGLANFLAFAHALAPETIFEGIYKLLPGHYLIARDDGIQITEYWDVAVQSELLIDRQMPEEQLAERILATISDSVRRSMEAEVPVGAFLSGGIDSSAVVALMRQHSTVPVQTFSLGFDVGGRYSELSDARMMADRLGTDHHEVQISHDDLVKTLRTLVYHYDEPFGDPAAFPLYLLSRFAREHVRVVLTGDGPEFTFGGCKRYVADQAAALYQRLPSVLTDGLVPRLVDRLPRLRRIKSIVHTLPIADPARRGASWVLLFTPEMQKELLQPEVSAALADYDPIWPYPRYYNQLQEPAETDPLNRLMYVEFKTMLPDLLLEKWDKLTMACGLEVRMPLLDHRLVDLAYQIPSRYKIHGWSSKHIFKQAVRRLVPAEVLQKPKHGLYVPTDPWFRGDLRTFTFEVLLDERTRRRGYFDMSMVERLWREHMEGRHVWSTHLWLLLNLEIWHRIYLDREEV